MSPSKAAFNFSCVFVFFLILFLVSCTSFNIPSRYHTTRISNFRARNVCHQARLRNEDDNLSLSLWLKIKETLPPLVHGSWMSNAGDDNPLGAIYNLIFVRIPTISVAAIYSYQLISNSEFQMTFDFGYGPVLIPSPIIAFAFVLILL
jgi:hypothetical protein